MPFVIKTRAEMENLAGEVYHRILREGRELIVEHNAHASMDGTEELVFALDETTNKVVGVNSFRKLTPFLTECKYLVVAKDRRREGIGKALARKVLEMVQTKFAICSIGDWNTRCTAMALSVGWATPGTSFPSKLHPSKRVNVYWFAKPDPPPRQEEISEFETQEEGRSVVDAPAVPADPPQEG